MATTKIEPQLRWKIRLKSPESLDEDLGFVGERVGPRKDPDKRTHGGKEDYVLRRLVVAFRESGRLRFPSTISAETERDGQPDFVIEAGDGSTVGIEVTEAGDEGYQAWLTRTESLGEDHDAVLIPGDGIVDRVEIERISQEFANAINKKLKQFKKGKYREPTTCDLAIYDNTAWGGFLDKREIVRRLRAMNNLRGCFGAIHLVFESHVAVDALGEGYSLVPIYNRYETDIVGWADDQAALLRRGELDRLDANNIAEELEALAKSDRRALRSHLQILLLHLLKWQFQPSMRATSWEYSIRNSRSEIHQLLFESPSLRTDLGDSIEYAFPRARRAAITETRLSEDMFPEINPYGEDELVEEGFMPGPISEED